MSNELIKIVDESQLQQDKSKLLVESYAGFYTTANQLATEAKTIKVESIDQVEEMQKARDIRLKLKAVRVETEKTRKELKEQSLREGKAIDGMANIIKALVVPVEEYLENQEKFAERIKEAEDKEVEQRRINELSKYVESVEVYKLHPSDMSTDTFEQLVKAAKTAHEAQIKAEQEAEAERARVAEEERKENERIREENAKLQKEREAREKELALERQKVEKEREAREKWEREAKEKQAAILAEQEAKAKAPDKDKVKIFVRELENIEFPKVATDEYVELVNNFKQKLNLLIVDLKNKL